MHRLRRTQKLQWALRSFWVKNKVVAAVWAHRWYWASLDDAPPYPTGAVVADDSATHGAWNARWVVVCACVVAMIMVVLC